MSFLSDFVDEFDDIFETDWNLSDFLIHKDDLGKGRFGNVYKVRHKLNGKQYAVKTMTIEEHDEEAKTLIRREIRNQSRVEHENIISIFGLFYNENRLFLLIELALNGDLYKRMKQCKDDRLEETFVRKCTRQLVDALTCLHSHNIIHRDVKPENVLLDENDNVKLADFGWSVQSRVKRNTLCGTIDYLSPEIVKGLPYDYHVDIWSLGVLVYDTLSGKAPFFRKTYKKTYDDIKNVSYTMPNFFSEDAKSFINVTLVAEPEKRAELEDLKQHAFLSE